MLWPSTEGRNGASCQKLLRCSLPVYLYCLLWVATSGPSLLATAQARNITVTNGQELADGVAQFGIQGGAITLVMQSFTSDHVISLANTTFWTPAQLAANSSQLGRAPFSSGVLDITSASGAASDLILDAHMRSDLTPQFASSTILNMRSFTMVDLCEQPLLWDRGYKSIYVTSLNVALFNRSRSYQSQTTTNMVFYARPADIGVYVYLQAAQRSTFAQVREVMDPLLRLLPPLTVSVAQLSHNFARFAVYTNPATRHTNLTFKSVYNHDDPVLQQLQIEGMLMPLQFCNGTLLPQEYLNTYVDPNMGPMFIVDNTQQWLEAVPQAAALIQANWTAWRPPPVVLLSGQADLTGITLAGAPYVFNYLGLLTGPFNDVPELAVYATLNLGQQSDILELSSGGIMFFARLPFADFAGTAKTAVAIPHKYTTTQAALPSLESTLSFSFVKQSNATDWLTRPKTWMHNMTLYLPTDDYLAMTELALRGSASSISHCTDANMIQRADQLNVGIAVMNVLASDQLGQWITLSAYTGWGLNTTMLRLVPENPDDPQIQSLSTCLSPSGHTKSITAPIAGGIVGGVVGILLVVLIICLLTRRRGAHQYTHGKAGAPEIVLVQDKACEEEKPLNSPVSFCCFTLWSTSPPTTQATVASAATALDAVVVLPVVHELSATERRPLAVKTVRLHDSALAMTSQTGVHHRVSSQASPHTATHTGTVGTDTQHASNSMPFNASEITAYEGVPLDEHMSMLAVVVTTAAHLSAISSVPVEAKAVAEAADMASIIQSSRRNSTGEGVASGQRPGTMHSSWDSSSARRLPGSAPSYHSSRHSSFLEQQRLRDDVEVRAMAMGADANRVEVGGVLGQGSWGTVYKGTWRGLPVALKTMLFDLPIHNLPGSSSRGGQEQEGGGAGPAQHSRAIMEAAIAASVGHRNVVCTYHFDIMPVHAAHDSMLGGLQIQMPAEQEMNSFQHDRETFKMFLVQELCATTLGMATHLGALHNQSTGETEEVPVFSVLLDIAHGLEYLHSKGIIHGDLKPANVLLKLDRTTPAGVVAKLADFGLSSSLDPGATHVSNYRSGTPFYVAPEVVHDFRTSFASDIFSFGVIMWQLYSGKSPYLTQEGQYMPNPDFPTFSPPRLPPAGYVALTHRCLQRDQKHRPTATQLVTALSNLLSQPQQPLPLN